MFQPYRNDSPKATSVEEKMRFLLSPPSYNAQLLKLNEPEITASTQTSTLFCRHFLSITVVEGGSVAKCWTRAQ